MPDAKFKSGSLSGFRDMTLQTCLSGRERVIKLGYLPLENGLK